MCVKKDGLGFPKIGTSKDGQIKKYISPREVHVYT